MPLINEEVTDPENKKTTASPILCFAGCIF